MSRIDLWMAQSICCADGSANGRSGFVRANQGQRTVVGARRWGFILDEQLPTTATACTSILHLVVYLDKRVFPVSSLSALIIHCSTVSFCIVQYGSKKVSPVYLGACLLCIAGNNTHPLTKYLPIYLSYPQCPPPFCDACRFRGPGKRHPPPPRRMRSGNPRW